MLYTSEKTGESYKTIAELEAAEKEYDAAAKESEQDERADEVRHAFNKLTEALSKASEEIKMAADDFMDLVKAYEEDYDDEVGIPLNVFYDFIDTIVNLF